MPSTNPEPAPYEPLTARYGSLGEGGEWRLAVEAYYADRLEESFALAQALGAGFGGGALRWYRMIEGEALTRQGATVEELTPGVSFEHDPSDVDLGREHHEAILASIREVGGRLGWHDEAPVRVTILLGSVDAPWHGARYGYCIDKEPFSKICVPRRAAGDPAALAEVVEHEFTHVVTLNLTGGRIPHWLDEGLAMLMEGDDSPFDGAWLEPDALDAAFEADRRDEEGLARSHAAYLQSAAIVRHLHGMGGDAKLAQLVRAFTNNGLWDEIKINLLGQPSVEEALHEVYGLGRRELFAAAQGA